jgi:hypothetical protein
MTKKKDQAIEKEENTETIDIKNIDFKELNYFPIGSKNKVRLNFIYGNERYITVLSGHLYKGFVINEENPNGYKFCEGQNEGDILNKIPHYWG